MKNTTSLLRPIALAASLLATFTPNAHAASKEAFGFWNQDLAQGNFGFANPALKDLRWWAEGQVRVFDHLDRVSQGLARAAIGYNLTDKLTFWAGYTWNPSRIADKPPTDEHDLFPALTYTDKTSWGVFSARSMTDFRFVDTKGPSAQTGYRYRQMVRFMHPFDFEPRLSLIGWDEIFFNLNDTDWGQKSGLDQNRGFVGLGWNFTKELRIETGYMNWFLNTTTGRDTERHMATVNFQANF
jgi:long-subunit fatty acid transport protein